MIAGNRWCFFALLLSGAIYAGFAARFFPNPSGRLGEDYSYFLPMLLAGRYWIAANGLWSPPFFSPAFCGGLPFLANPQSIFYSLPQALAVVVDPETSFYLTGVISAWFGGFGTFVLMRRRFDVSVPAAALGAAIYLFNGFLLYRMAVGHVTYLTLGLLPLLCHLLLTPLAGRPDPMRRAIFVTALGSAILVYIVYAGAPNMIVPLALAVLAVWLLYALVRRPAWSFWPLGAAAGVIAALAGAAKLAPAAVYVDHFARDGTLYLFPDAATALSVLSRAFFLPSTLPDFPERHEFEFGLGLVPLVLIVAGACVAIARGAVWRRVRPRRWAAAAALAVVLALPLWLNIGGPDFAAWLQRLPYVGENGILVRWFVIWQLPLTSAAALMLDFVFADARARGTAALVGIAATVAQVVFADTSHYRHQPYDPTAILAADRSLRATGAPPPVTAIAARGDYPDNDGLVAGQSSFPCYEPLFGYKLQSFPWGLRVGTLAQAGRHLRNPACYIYGAANGCSPGETFTSERSEAAFAAYRPFPYRRPWWQQAADLASLLGLAAILGGIALGLCGSLRRRRAAQGIG